jgi:hypothetical protein
MGDGGWKAEGRTAEGRVQKVVNEEVRMKNSE